MRLRTPRRSSLISHDPPNGRYRRPQDSSTIADERSHIDGGDWAEEDTVDTKPTQRSAGTEKKRATRPYDPLSAEQVIAKLPKMKTENIQKARRYEARQQAR